MADDLSLLFKIRGDAAGGVKAAHDQRAAVAQLRTALGSDFQAMQQAGQKALSGIGDNINTFVGARVPLIGGAFLRVGENLRSVGSETKKATADLSKFDKTIDKLSTSTGKSKSELINFLTSFVQLGTQAKRDTAVIETFGAAAAQKLIPQLEKAGNQLLTVATNAGAAGSSLAAIAGPVGIAVIALLALTAAGAFVVKEFLELTVRTAEWQGKLHDISQQTEVSVETLSGLEVALRKAGGELGSATNAIITFQTKLADAQDPMSDTALRFEVLGITATDTEGAFRQALAAVAAMPDGFEKVNTAAELFGRRGAKQLLAAIKETDGDLDKLIRQLKATGVLLEGDVARAADEFNDQLLLVQLQVRALTAELVTDSIPQILSALRATSKIISENKESIEIIGRAIGVFVKGNVYGILLPALKTIELAVGSIEKAWQGVQFASLVASGVSVDIAAEAVRAAKEAANRVSPIDKGTAEESGLGGDLKTRQEIRASQERLTQAKREADELKRISAERLAQAEIDFKRGKITRDQQLAQQISSLNAATGADVKRLNAEIEVNEKRNAALAGNAVEQKKTSDKIYELENERRNKLSELARAIDKEKNEAFQSENKALLDHLERQAELRKEADAAEIKRIQARVELGELLASDGEDAITRIENAGLQARKQILEQEQAANAQGFDKTRSIKESLAELERERTETVRQQSERRKQIVRDELEHERSLLLARLDTQLRLGTISDNAQIASLRALAALRIRTNEQTEQAILAIRLAALDREAEAVRARLTAAGSTADPKARAAEEQRLNSELKIILAERTVLVDQGARDVDEGRQRDLDGLRRYRDAYRELLEEVAEDERDIARLRIQMLITSRASRSVILQAEFEEETAHADRRHARELNRLREDYDAAKESAKGMQEKLAALQAYNLAVEAENERHELDEKEREERKRQAKLAAGPVGGFLGGLETGQLKELENGIQSFQDMAVVAFSAVGAAVNGLAQGIGGLVQNWVLMGNTGPNAMRKMVASVLAGVAAQAAVQAIMFTAYGIAALTPWGAAIYGPASQWFIAAALMASIATVTGLAGRAVAGNVFQTGAGGAGSADGTSASDAPRDRTIRESRTGGASNPNEAIGTLKIDIRYPDGSFETQAVRVFRKNGQLRTDLRNDLLGEANG